MIIEIDLTEIMVETEKLEIIEMTELRLVVA